MITVQRGSRSPFQNRASKGKGAKGALLTTAKKNNGKHVSNRWKTWNKSKTKKNIGDIETKQKFVRFEQGKSISWGS